MDEVVLRPFNKDDINVIANYANNPRVSSWMTNQFPYPYTTDHAQEFVKRVSAQSPLQVLAISVNQKFGGAIGIHPQSDIFELNAELGYWLAESYWGKGIATRAVQQMIEYGFKTFHINRIFARPFGSNKGSQRVLEKNGFQLEAVLKGTIFKNGKFEDELIYAIRKNQ
jgi:RimJ/RimL family protein N-acetyltransferase